jgi:hypothetical protein
MKASATLDGEGIMKLAGELDDRWPGSRKRTGREESPDTETAQAVWATRLVTPGDEVAEGGAKPPLQ